MKIYTVENLAYGWHYISIICANSEKEAEILSKKYNDRVEEVENYRLYTVELDVICNSDTSKVLSNIKLY